MSLLVTSLFVAGGVLVGRWLARDAEHPRLPERSERTSSVAPPPPPSRRAPVPAVDWGTFPCALGDVVVRAGGEEAWLAGALVLREESPAAVLFVAPEAGTDRAVLARPRPRSDLVWLAPLPEASLVVGPEPPTSIEVAGVRYERVRRLPLYVERVGAGAPDVGDRVLFAEYAGGGTERVVVLAFGGTSRAWRGVALDEGSYDVLPG